MHTKWQDKDYWPELLQYRWPWPDIHPENLVLAQVVSGTEPELGLAAQLGVHPIEFTVAGMKIWESRTIDEELERRLKRGSVANREKILETMVAEVKEVLSEARSS